MRYCGLLIAHMIPYKGLKNRSRPPSFIIRFYQTVQNIPANRLFLIILFIITQIFYINFHTYML